VPHPTSKMGIPRNGRRLIRGLDFGKAIMSHYVSISPDDLA
jgi:hypothetical protein